MVFMASDSWVVHYSLFLLFCYNLSGNCEVIEGVGGISLNYHILCGLSNPPIVPMNSFHNCCQ